MNHKHEDNIKCPYCGWEDQDSWEFNQECGTFECGECDKEFNVTRYVEVTYSTSRIPCEDGKHNYKINRYFIRKRTLIGGEWENLQEQDWIYFRIVECQICDKEDFIEVTKKIYEHES